MNGKTVRVATDVGGTFTDLVYFESDPLTGEPITSEPSGITLPSPISELAPMMQC